MTQAIDIKEKEGQQLTFREQYIQPLSDHPVIKKITWCGKEIVKIAVTTKILEIVVANCLKPSSSLPASKIYGMTVLAPVLEEVLFRGILLPGIHCMQYLLSKNDLTDEELEKQRNYRVQLSALIFGAAHLTNPHEHVAGALIQFTWSYIGGVVYGHLSEKYQTLSVSILAHALNNSLAVASMLAVTDGRKGFFLIAVFVSKIGIYVLCVKTKIADNVVERVNHAIVYCGTIPRQVIDWCASKPKQGEALETV